MAFKDFNMTAQYGAVSAVFVLHFIVFTIESAWRWKKMAQRRREGSRRPAPVYVLEEDQASSAQLLHSHNTVNQPFPDNERAESEELLEEDDYSNIGRCRKLTLRLSCLLAVGVVLNNAVSSPEIPSTVFCGVVVTCAIVSCLAIGLKAKLVSEAVTFGGYIGLLGLFLNPFFS